ncbi:MAG: NUDIX hydrolase [Deltaproteobacteria bacterium]|nr:NUDIX hydrolase [Deltaproteobacteria bacterium]NND29688.1 NUDIX hydrolase [Myxococcales bacterium]MBT8466057.1 NUDIX hydrolase [Deltaproteobacteria bacterium]MBT8483623.1 NUDIX hydrolase [Deltaproteobacteria bacterium]NNK09316.1 NUDIX hydrolase [Myxococcales bacterium]
MTERDKGPRIRKVPVGDNRQRLVCPDCEYVAYENPKVVVGVVATWEDTLLMCKRAIEPRLGFWTLPAGFMELGETPEEGASREAWEEACAELEIIDLLAVYSLRHISQLQLFYRARLVSPDVSPGVESEEVGLFRFDELPASDLAFPSVRWAIDHFQQVRGAESFVPFRNPPGHSGEMKRRR